MIQHQETCQIYYCAKDIPGNPYIHCSINGAQWETFTMEHVKKNIFLFTVDDLFQIQFVFCDQFKQCWDNPDQIYTKQKYKKKQNYFIQKVDQYIIVEKQIQILHKKQSNATDQTYIISADLDGTLLGNFYSLKLFNILWLSKFQFNDNFQLVYNSGRILSEFNDIRNKLVQPDFQVGGCGLMVRSKVYNIQQLTNEQFSKQSHIRRRIIETFSEIKQLKFRNFPQVINFIVDYNDLKEIYNRILQKRNRLRDKGVKLDLIISHTGEFKYIDVVPEGFGKYSGIEFVRNYLMNVNELFTKNVYTISFGDSLNDLDMLLRSQQGIIVNNGDQQLLIYYETLDEQSKLELSNLQYADCIIKRLNEFK